jgi:hypothetical protein
MPVKSLNQFEKRIIADDFQALPNSYQINRLAADFKVSRRTIIRVLEKQGLDPKIQRRNRKPKAEVAETQNCAPQGFRLPMPWYTRAYQRVCEFFAS